jgi:hypothetical protein
VYVNDAIRKPLNQADWDKPQKPGQYDPVDMMLQQVIQDLTRIIKLIPAKNQNRQIILFSPLNDESIRTVGADTGNPYQGFVLEVCNNVFCVGA